VEGMCDTCGRTEQLFFGTYVGAAILKISMKKDGIFFLNGTGRKMFSDA